MTARSASYEVASRKFNIYARSSDLNPIKIIYHIAKQRLSQEALDQQINQEDFAAFFARKRLRWNQYLLVWWTELSFPWARESMELLNKKDQ